MSPNIPSNGHDPNQRLVIGILATKRCIPSAPTTDRICTAPNPKQRGRQAPPDRGPLPRPILEEQLPMVQEPFQNERNRPSSGATSLANPKPYLLRSNCPCLHRAKNSSGM